MKDYGLTQDILERIRMVFSKYDRVEEVLLYGSRAMGHHNPTSDIDLALKGSGLDLRLQSKIEWDLDDLMLPCKFDLCLYDRISEATLLDHINRLGQVIYTRKKDEDKSSDTTPQTS